MNSNDSDSIVLDLEVQKHIRALISNFDAPTSLSELCKICSSLITEVHEKVNSLMGYKDIIIFSDMLRSQTTIWAGDTASNFCANLFDGPEGWFPNVDEFLAGEQGYYYYYPVTFRDEPDFYAAIRALIEEQGSVETHHMLSVLSTGLPAWENSDNGGVPASMAIRLAVLWTLQERGKEFQNHSLIPTVSAAGFIDYYDQELELASFLNSDSRSEFQFLNPVNEFLAMAIGLSEYKPLSEHPLSIMLVDGWNIGEEVSVNEYIGTILLDVLNQLTDGEAMNSPDCKETVFLLNNSIEGIPWFIRFLINHKTWEWIVENIEYLPEPCTPEELSHLLGHLLDDESVPKEYRSAVGQHLNSSMVQEWQHLLLAK